MRARFWVAVVMLVATVSSAWAAVPTLCGGTKTTSGPTTNCKPPASPS